MRIKQFLWFILFNGIYLFSLPSHSKEQYLDVWFNEFLLKINSYWKLEVVRRDDKQLEFLVLHTKNNKQLAIMQMLPFDENYTKQLSKKLGENYSAYEHKDIGKKVCYFNQTPDELRIYLKNLGNILILKGEPKIIAKILDLQALCGIKKKPAQPIADIQKHWGSSRFYYVDPIC